jgi:hypothetical protein
MAFNKHNFKHPGGYVHAGMHGAVTTLILWGRPEFWVMGLFETAVHYLIDNGKMNLSRALELTPKTKGFWYALGFDQWLHYCTYLLILYYYFGT